MCHSCFAFFSIFVISPPAVKASEDKEDEDKEDDDIKDD